jgi:hypothetical protein
VLGVAAVVLGPPEPASGAARFSTLVMDTGCMKARNAQRPKMQLAVHAIGFARHSAALI